MLVEALKRSKAERLYVLDYGLFRVRSDGRAIGICGFLIRTDDGKSILVDTGFPAKYAEDPVAASAADRLGEFGEIVALTADNLPAAQLAKIGLAPGDIDLLVTTHTHIDHIGGLGDFPHAPMLIARAERALERPIYWAGLHPVAWPAVKYVLIGRDEDVCGGVRVLFTPGHTPGQLALLIDLPEEGKFVVTGDAISRPAELDEGFAGAWDEALAARHARRLVALAEAEGAAIIYGHCPDQWPTLRKAPAFYR